MTDNPKNENHFLDLDLEDIAPAGTIVRLAGHDYTLRHPDALSLVEVSSLQQAEKGLDKAMKRLGEHGDDQRSGREAEAMTDRIIRVILPDLPVEELAKLGYIKKVKIYAFFGGKLADFEAAMQVALRPASPSITPTSSPD